MITSFVTHNKTYVINDLNESAQSLILSYMNEGIGFELTKVLKLN